MTGIDLIYNAGFPWYVKGDCHVKGFVHTSDGRCVKGDPLAVYFSECSEFDTFKERVSGSNGMFAVVMQRSGQLWLGVDRMRTFPLFYSVFPERSRAVPGTLPPSGILVSDSVDRIINKTGHWNMNREAEAEFLATGFVSGRETLAEGIFQVQAGEVLGFESPEKTGGQSMHPGSGFYSSYRTAAYARHSGEMPRREAVDQLMEELGRLGERVFRRLTRSLEGKTAVVALSGGYDSRFVAAMLKKLEYPKVICFSYGREGNPDMLRAEEVAQRLGFTFIPIVYTDELVGEYTQDENFAAYVRFSANHTSMFFMQEYFALRYLKEKRLVPGDGVFIPGHSGDFFGGSQLIRHGLHGGEEPVMKTIRRIYDVKYAWYRPGGTQRRATLKRIERTVREKDIPIGAAPYSVHEDWDLKEKLAKFIVNSCNIYAWYGFEYRLPLYDHELQDFFRDVPFTLKANKQLYDEYLRGRVFGELNLNFDRELQPDVRTQRKSHLKRRIRRRLPGRLIPSTIPVRDPIFYNEITRVLKEDLARRGMCIRMRGNSYNSLIVQWYIEFLKSEKPPADL